MNVVIQCAARKRNEAGHLQTTDGRRVMFVADPDTAPITDNLVHARPDDPSGTDGKSWRAMLAEYNEHPDENEQNLLPAWQLYANPTYEYLARHARVGVDRLYILSAGWGLLSASFLTPRYDITFSNAKDVKPFQRRRRRDSYQDFSMLPADVGEPVLFLGGRDYIPLFCELTAKVRSERTIYYAGRAPTVPGCTLARFGAPFTNWHYQCARSLFGS